MSAPREMDRRTFAKLVGGGVVVWVSLGPAALLAQERRRGYPEDLNAYLRVDENGHVTVFSGKIEMGQGVLTSQAQMAAEELGVALDAIEMVLGDTDRCPWDMGTFGSLTTRMFGPALRAAAAEARAVLTSLAAKQLGVGKERLVVKDGVASVAGDPARKVTYGELAKGKTIARLVDEKAVLRSVKELTVMGRSTVRLDAREKVTGRARYAGDVRLPGMLHARILRPPAHGARLKQVETAPAKEIPGVAVVNQDGLVAVLHVDPEVAARALAALVPVWEAARPGPDTESIFDHVVAAAPAPEVRLARGDTAAARAGGAPVIEATYRSGYRAHAPMEPHTAVAELKDGKLTVWASTQTPFPIRDRIAEAVGLAPKDVRVVTPFVGGGFGGKSAGGQAVEAARLAKATGRPVQVAYTRAEEFFNDTFDPASVVKIASAVDGNGKISLWEYDVTCAGPRGTELFYDVPNARIRTFGSWMGSGTEVHRFGVGPWRAPGANTNVFAAESQVDTMAAAAGADPLAFRLANTSDPRMRRVLKAATDAAGWKASAGLTRTGRGLACGIDAGTYVALVAQVKVDAATGAVQVERVVCAQDMGLVVNPDGARMQMEGCITMGLGYVLSEEVRVNGGEILDRNFGTYQIPRFSWLPRIETVLVPNDDLPPQGGGEPAIVVMGAAVANAVFDATGARIRRLPMTRERVLAALRTSKNG